MDEALVIRAAFGVAALGGFLFAVGGATMVVRGPRRNIRQLGWAFVASGAMIVFGALLVILGRVPMGWCTALWAGAALLLGWACRRFR